MGMDRRAVLGGLAAGALAAGGGGWWLASGGLTRLRAAGPYGPWKAWRGRPAEPALNLLRAAILASNPNNAQPWLFRVGEDRIEVFADPGRSAGKLDPYLREVHLGVGCALENMALVAPANGLALDVRYSAGRLGQTMPAGPAAGPAAIVTLRKQAGAASPLLDQVPLRHTNRGPYDPARAVPDDAVAALGAIAETEQVKVLWLPEPERRRRFGDMTVQATRRLLIHPTLVPQWQRWLRPDKTAEASRDGVPIDVALKDAAANWVDSTRMQVDSAPLIGVLSAEDPYDLPTVLHCGRAWQRIHLEATRRGLAVQPLDQILWRMEYEEDLTAQSVTAPAVYDLMASGTYRPVLFFRIGHAKQPAAETPRRPLQAVLLPDT